MSLQDRISYEQLEKLMKVKETLPAGTPPASLSEVEHSETEIQNELLRQAQLEEDHSMISEDYFDSMTGPSSEDGSKSMVGVEYSVGGEIGQVYLYVNISFDDLVIDLPPEHYETVMENVEAIAFGDDVIKSREAAKEIEAVGEEAIAILFRECRKFDYNNIQKTNLIVHLLSRLTVRSLKGRSILKAILENSTSPQHIRLAIMVAGSIRDINAADVILEHAKDPVYMESAFEALMKIRAKRSIKPLIQLLKELDSDKKDLIDQAHRLARRFNEFGPDAIEEVYHAYLDCKHHVRPIFTVALRSFQDEAIPFLVKVLETEKDEQAVIKIAKSLGDLKHQYATNALVEAFKKFPSKKPALIEGFSHTQDSSLVPIILSELNEADTKMKRKCLNALAYLGSREHIPMIKPFAKAKETKPDALFCMARLGDSHSFEEFMHQMIEGESEIQYILERYTSKLPFALLTEMASRTLRLPDDQALLIVSALQRPNLLPREVGPILCEKLKQNGSAALKIEIYRLIGKYANQKGGLVPQDVLYEARRTEENPRVKRELEQIIKNMRQSRGHVYAYRD